MAAWDKQRVIDGIAPGQAGAFGDARQIQENIEAMAEAATGSPQVSGAELELVANVVWDSGTGFITANVGAFDAGVHRYIALLAADTTFDTAGTKGSMRVAVKYGGVEIAGGPSIVMSPKNINNGNLNHRYFCSVAFDLLPWVDGTSCIVSPTAGVLGTTEGSIPSDLAFSVASPLVRPTLLAMEDGELSYGDYASPNDTGFAPASGALTIVGGSDLEFEVQELQKWRITSGNYVPDQGVNALTGGSLKIFAVRKDALDNGGFVA